MEKGKIIIIFTTVNSKEKADKIALELVSNKLAACISVIEAFSTYYWQGKIEREREYILEIKTASEKQNEILNWLKENHPYTVPELIVLDAQAYGDYLKWLREYVLK
ncbi:MAG: divalent-cation tolerance protein CutA [Candidatus Njordarchaeales archaeon]